MTGKSRVRKAPVIDLFTGRVLQSGEDKRIVRLSPEFDSLCMLYCNDANPGKLFKLKIIAWGLQRDGEVVGLVPWLNSITPCPTLKDPLNGHWEGYLSPHNGHVFYDAPAYKRSELEAAYELYGASTEKTQNEIIQEIPDTIGTHAVFADKTGSAFEVTEVLSWQLHPDGQIIGMLINPDKVQQTPVLTGDKALYPVNESPYFRYFFQYGIANKIKTNDPEAIRAMSALIRL
jgi:hypothetical protein